MKIRLFNSDNLARIVEIDNACFEPGIAYSEEEFYYLLYIERVKCYVAEVNGEIAGFVIVRKKDVSVGEIVTIDIDSCYRRQQIGTRLLAFAEEKMKDAYLIRSMLQVDISNRGAITFYTQMGYEKKKRLKNYYRRNRDAYEMVKEL